MPIDLDKCETPEQRQSAEHFNALTRELRWFFEQGVKLRVRPTKKGYEIQLSAPPVNPVHPVRKPSVRP